jgi:hypothetical protein
MFCADKNVGSNIFQFFLKIFQHYSVQHFFLLLHHHSRQNLMRPARAAALLPAGRLATAARELAAPKGAGHSGRTTTYLLAMHKVIAQFRRFL